MSTITTISSSDEVARLLSFSVFGIARLSSSSVSVIATFLSFSVFGTFLAPLTGRLATKSDTMSAINTSDVLASLFLRLPSA